MKRALLFAILLALATPLIAEEKIPGFLKKCPFGHKDLILVPIAYGLPMDFGKPEKGEGKLPAVFEGGCVTTPDSPRNVVGCPECGFFYGTHLTKDWKKGDWTISVSDRAELFKPLSTTLSDFPGIEGNPKKAKASYVQTLDRHDRLTSESIRIERKGKLADAEALLKPWLTSKGIDPQTADRSEGMITWRSDRLAVSVFEDGRVLNLSVRNNFKNPSGP